MPSPTVQSAEQRSRARRETVGLLQITECTVRYASARLSNGAGPAEARQTALFVAAELERVAAGLRRLVAARLDLTAAERRALAVELAGLGLSQREIAGQVGRSERRVWDYLRGRS